MHEKEVPHIVKGEIISSDEARQARHKAFSELKTCLESICTDFARLLLVELKSSPMNRSALKSLQSKLSVLREDTERAEEHNLDTERWISQIRVITNLFNQIHNEELEAALIEPETSVLMVRFRIASINDANNIIDDPKAALVDYENFTFAGEYRRLGKEFQELFPRFRGYQVEIDPRYDGFSIDLRGNPPTDASIPDTPAEAIKPLVAEFLGWHLRKIGYTMRFDFIVLDQKTMICEVGVVDDDDPLLRIIDYQQSQAESSDIDVTNMNEFLMGQLKTEVDNDWREQSYANTEFYHPVGKTTTKRLGRWLWIKSQVMYGGVKWDPSTDRSGGDFEITERWHDWVGPGKSVPRKVNRPEELDKWAEIKTSYSIHNLLHEGSEIVEITESGEVNIRVDTFRYPNVESKYEQTALKNTE